MKRFRDPGVGKVLALVASMVLLTTMCLLGSTTYGQASLVSGGTKTVCVGRFLIDLPVEATVHLGRGFVSGYDVASTDRETDDEFSARLQEFENMSDEPDFVTGPRRIEAVIPISFTQAQGKVFTFNRREVRIPEGKEIVTIEDVDVQGMLRFPRVSIAAKADGMSLDSGDELARLLQRFRPLERDEIPSEPGFCIGHAIVRDPYEHPENEGVVMFAGLPGHPDVSIVLSSMAGTKPAPGLIARHRAAVERKPVLMRLPFTHLRERPRTMNGLTGDELVMRVLELNFTTGFSFQWEMAGEQDDIYAPVLTLEMESGTNPLAGGKPVESSLSESAMSHVWDRIAGSIRLRPTSSCSAERSMPQPAA